MKKNQLLVLVILLSMLLPGCARKEIKPTNNVSGQKNATSMDKKAEKKKRKALKKEAVKLARETYYQKRLRDPEGYPMLGSFLSADFEKYYKQLLEENGLSE